MKVDVVQIGELKLGRFRHWSNWIDVAVFNYGTCGYLLQMRVSIWNKKQFRTAPFKTRNFFDSAQAVTNDVKDLVQMEGDRE